MLIRNKLIIAMLVASCILLTQYETIYACTYNASIIGNRLDFEITSDTDKLGLVQYFRRSGTALVSSMVAPEVDEPWQYFDDYFCNVFVDFPIGCRQIRNDIQFGVLGTGAYWQWTNFGYAPYKPLPSGVWTLYFDSPPTYESLGIEYATTEAVWYVCTRVGDVLPASFTTKTVFAPGLMASWNADAILNCNPDTNTEWVLAPYAEEVYNPIIQAIAETGWETIPYYYDWRKPVSENSQKLVSFLNSETSSNEKVNFVGHSMGGLVGRGYLDTSDGSKLESLLTVGTPNTGSAYAYAPWEGGEIWSNSLIEKIALTIYLRHCGDAGQNDMEIIREEVPSIQDLLPTYPYLKRIKSDAPYLPNKNENLNSWITGLSSDSKGVRLGYIAGTGYETIETIQTKDPNKKDVREGLWEDGKPAGRISTDMGDGTVTTSSAVLPVSDWSAVITQDHRGLVNSVEGMSKILEFLGTPNTSNISTEMYNPDSALVLIGYPGLFSVTDENGKIKQSKEGMVALMNPKSGNYKVNLLPKSENTLFIVAQFLPNGEVKYKEYNLKGLTPKFKTLKFDPQNPSEDILN